MNPLSPRTCPGEGNSNFQRNKSHWDNNMNIALVKAVKKQKSRFHSLIQDQSMVAQQAETNVYHMRFLPSCMQTNFPAQLIKGKKKTLLVLFISGDNTAYQLLCSYQLKQCKQVIPLYFFLSCVTFLCIRRGSTHFTLFLSLFMMPTKY